MRRVDMWMQFKMWRDKKAAQRQAKLDRAYDGYSPSFDQTIKNAPVRREWLEEQTMLGLAWYRLKTATLREWIEGFIFIVVWISLLYFMLSR